MNGSRVAFLLLVVTSGCEPSLGRGSSHGAELAELFWLLVGITGIAASIGVAIVVAVAVRAWRRVGGAGDVATDAVDADRAPRWVLLAGGIAPLVVVAATIVVTARTEARMRTTEAEANAAVTVDVVGHRFWWEVLYPSSGVVTANRAHVPAGAPVRLRLTSADVIHSLWAPGLHPQREMVPGQITELLFSVDEPGVHRGRCYTLCGRGHAQMELEWVVLPRAEFDAFIDARRAAATLPDGPLATRGLDVFHEARCASCHRVRGITRPDATTAPGPDLTHVASRRRMDGARMADDLDPLRGWIEDACALETAPTRPSMADRRALVRFLETLE